MIIKELIATFEHSIMKTMKTTSLKYKTEIEQLILKGATLPGLNVIENKLAYRYVFKEPHNNNHKPIYIQNPKRIITDSDKSRIETSGYALSCFEDENQAVKKFEDLKINSKNIGLLIGDSLASGLLCIDDGLITKSNDKSHFDLYEFSECDLSSKFTVKKQLI